MIDYTFKIYVYDLNSSIDFYKFFYLHSKPGAFLTKHPLELLQQLNSLEIPIMIGTNDKDGLVMVRNSRRKLHLFDADHSRMIPTNPQLPSQGAVAEELGHLIKHFYCYC